MSQFSKHLLEQATELASRETTRPRQASLRRAVSAAYYALFHLLTDEAASLVAGAAGPVKSRTDLRRLVGRAFTHTQIKNACGEMVKGTPVDILKPFWSDLEIPHQSELIALAKAFLNVQEERHRADYDLSHAFTRAEVQVILERVEKATQDWQKLKKDHRRVAHFFALSMIMVDSWRKR